MTTCFVIRRLWRRSKFRMKSRRENSLDGSVRVRAGDRQGRENISRYLIRAPFSVDKIQYSCREGSVIYKTKMVKGPNRNFQVYDPLDFLAAVTAHIPEQLDVKYVPFFDS
jgi:hypothetical protein